MIHKAVLTAVSIPNATSHSPTPFFLPAIQKSQPMSHNPFEAPETMDYQSADVSEGGLKLATRGQRFVNSFLDGIVIRVGSFGLGFVSAAAMIGQNGGQALTQEQELTANLIGILLGFMCMIGYYLIMELTFQRTLGKLATGTQVVTVDGGVPSFGQILGRSFARLIPFDALTFLGNPSVGWHDKLSGTRVVTK